MSHTFANGAKPFTYVNEHDEEINIQIEDIPYYLTVHLLEENWKSYKSLLSIYTEYRKVNNINTEIIQEVLNNTSEYDSWYSTHVQSLSYLVGEQVEGIIQEKKDKPDEEIWYGMDTSIPDEEGCEILDLMIKNGAKIDIPNYYDETILQSISRKGRLSERTNNEKFVSKLQEYFSKL